MSPEALGPGDVRIGIAGGAGYSFNNSYVGAEGQVFVDVGVGKNVDLRIRGSAQYGYAVHDNLVENYLLAPGVLVKVSNKKGNAAFVGGVDVLFLKYDYYESHCYMGCNHDHEPTLEDHFKVLPTPVIGGVFSTGEKGKLRGLFSVTASIPIWDGYGHLKSTAGLDIPVSDKVSLRPELAFDVLISAGASFITGIGMAVVF